jgi:transposase
MRERRKFTVAFKRQVVEELLSRSSTLGQLSRRLDVSSGLILHWKKRYEAGGLTEGSSGDEKGLRSRIAQLERMVGRLAMENDLLKTRVTLSKSRSRNRRSPRNAESACSMPPWMPIRRRVVSAVCLSMPAAALLLVL